MLTTDEWQMEDDYQIISSTPEIPFNQLFDNDEDVGMEAAANLVSPTTSLSPKGNIGKTRRSRASKKAPPTLLNASPNNFRALVQQFTGCHSMPPSFKGPINLNFEQYSYYSGKSADQVQRQNPLSDQTHCHESVPSSTSDQSSSRFPFNNKICNNAVDDHDLHMDWQQLYSGGTTSYSSEDKIR